MTVHGTQQRREKETANSVRAHQTTRSDDVIPYVVEACP